MSKQVLLALIVARMQQTFRENKSAEYDRLISFINSLQGGRYCSARFLNHPKKDLIDMFVRLSATKEFNFAFPQNYPFTLIRKLSKPLFFPLCPLDSLSPCYIDFTYNISTLGKDEHIGLICLKIYDVPGFSNNPKAANVRYRFSRGKKLRFWHPTLKFISESKWPLIVLSKHFMSTAKETAHSIGLQEISRKHVHNAIILLALGQFLQCSRIICKWFCSKLIDP